MKTWRALGASCVRKPAAWRAVLLDVFAVAGLAASGCDFVGPPAPDAENTPAGNPTQVNGWL